MRRDVLAVRLDSMGDVLVTGPAIRALAAACTRLTVLAGPTGAESARLLPGVDDVVVWPCPWILATPPPVSSDSVRELVERIAWLRVDEAVIFTSFHQSALPTALLLRLAGVRRIAAVSTDYAGSLLDARLAEPDDAPEPERMLDIARGAGFELPAGDDGRLAVRRPLVPPPALPRRPYIVLHPGATASARAFPAARWAELATALSGAGCSVVVTGSAREEQLTAQVASGGRLPGHVRDWGGGLDLMALAAVLERAATVVVGNTGPAHLAAAVGTPVVSLFAPVISGRRWAPYGVPVELLGDQRAPCRDTRARVCTVPGHPCLSDVPVEDICAAVHRLAGTTIREEVTV
jgi:ADP-heptose:LPS heptosyltransferase